MGNVAKPEDAVVAVEGANRAAAELDQLFQESEEPGCFVACRV
jgi:hypothetical protein